MVKPVEIEIDGKKNESLSFRPLQRTIRGRFDMMRVNEPMAKVEANNWPSAIPSQRIGIDSDGAGYVAEPLQDEENKALREKIEKEGFKIEPALQTYEAISVPTWQYWIRRAVQSGLATLTKGNLPEKIDESRVKKNFVTNEENEKSPTDRLTEAIEQQNQLFAKLIDKLADRND